MVGQKDPKLTQALTLASRGMDLEKAWRKCGKLGTLKNARRAFATSLVAREPGQPAAVGAASARAPCLAARPQSHVALGRANAPRTHPRATPLCERACPCVTHPASVWDTASRQPG